MRNLEEIVAAMHDTLHAAGDEPSNDFAELLVRVGIDCPACTEEVIA